MRVRLRRTRRLLLLACGVAALAFPAQGSAQGSAQPAQPAAAGSNCYVGLDLPHVSSSTGPTHVPGVIAKARIHCSPGGHLKWGGHLFLCPTFPTADTNWLKAHCVIKKTNSNEAGGATFPTGQTTRYIPPTSQAGARGRGYWIAQAFWADSGGRLETGIGPAAYISLP